ncbi:amidohydrolase [Xanthobacteraceae bacterium Astr-EGSB]|uniref:amidohydrolase n=1 Tax=Astrobacterium formosum TaxID=3069710 RepID=UPI0027B0A479|nr:amidohydrolase [Xanthobacteraceae bacterium Astr-EGSB]
MCIACAMGNAIFGGFEVSRRTLMRGAGAAAFTAGISPGDFLCSDAGAQTFGDVLYTGGPIITLDDRRPVAEAVLVHGGRIAAVGTRAEVEAQKQRPARIVDLKGRTLVPGFVDPHGHMVMVGLQALAADLLPPPDGKGKDIAAIQRLLKAWIRKNTGVIAKYKLALGFGYDDSQLKEQRHPTRDDLDAVSKDIPIIIVHQSGHIGVVNSKALEAANISAATQDPEGGVFRRRDGNSEPNGVCEEYAFFHVLGALAARFDEAAFLAMIKAGARFYTRFGYTTAQEGRATKASAAMLEKAAAANMLPIDVVSYPDILDAVEFIKPSPQYKNRYRVGGAKLTIDGTPQGKTAWLTKPYFVPPPGSDADYRGYPAVTAERITAAVDLAFANGWQILTHANGDAAIDALLAAIRQATEKHGKRDRRAVMVHGQTCREDQLDIVKELDVFPSFFPMHTFYWGDWHRASVLGPERAENISPCGSALRRGLKFTSHHDAPVANPDSMRVLSATVTRTTRSGYVLGPDQRVNVDAALKAMSLWSAYQHFEEADKGSVEVGKLADFAILSDNPLTIAPEKLAAIKVVETVKEGTTVYKRA